jgi:predicted PurR-regulated permease PerM
MADQTTPEPFSGDESYLDRLRDDGMPDWLPRFFLWALAIIIAFLIAYGVIDELAGLLRMLFAALFLSIAFDPLVERLHNRGWRRGLSAGLLIAAMIIAGLLMFGLILPAFVDAIGALLDALPSAVSSLQEWLLGLGFDVDLEGTLERLGELQVDWATLVGSLAGGILGFGAALVNILFNLLTIGLFAFYLTADGPRWRRALLSRLPAARQREFMWVWRLSVEKTGGYIYSRAIMAALSGGLSGVVFWIIGLPFPLGLGVFVGIVSQFVPVVGTYIAGAVPVVIGLVGGWQDAVAVLVWIIVYQQIENYLIGPRITANTMELHPAVAFGAAIAGAVVYGPLGALMALPVAATVQAFLSTYLNRHELVHDEEAAAIADSAGDVGVE